MNKGGIVRSGSEIPFFDGHVIKNGSAVKIFDGYKIKDGQAVKIYQNYNCYAHNDTTVITGGIRTDGSCSFIKPGTGSGPATNIALIHFIFPSPVNYTSGITFAIITNPLIYGNPTFAFFAGSEPVIIATYTPQVQGETMTFVPNLTGATTDIWFGIEQDLPGEEYRLDFSSGALTIGNEQIIEVILT